jgi:hypothetical protein
VLDPKVVGPTVELMLAAAVVASVVPAKVV